MFENIIKNNGFNIAISGIIIVFAGLVLIALTIIIFNKIFHKAHQNKEVVDKKTETVPEISPNKIPDDILTAISVGIECYRKIHFDELQTEITFKHGGNRSAWSLGSKFEQRERI